MKLFFKCYGIFSHLPYKIIMFVVLPILAAGFEVLGRFAGLGMFGLHLTAFTAAIIFADTWVLNGICNKKSISLDFVNSSKRGLLVMKLAVISDVVMRFVLCMVIFTITGFIGGYLFAGITFGLVCFVISSIGLTICRHLDSVQVVMMITAFGATLSSLASTGIIYWQPEIFVPGVQGFGEFLPLIIVSVLAIAVAFGATIYTIKRVEGTYHD